MKEEPESSRSGVFEDVRLCLAFLEVAIESYFEYRRIVTSGFLVNDELFFVFANEEGNQ